MSIIFSGEENLYKIKVRIVEYIVLSNITGSGDVITVGKTLCHVYERSQLLNSQNGFISDDTEAEPDLPDSKTNDTSSTQSEMQWIGNFP